MRKKLVISLSVLLGLVAIALTLCFTVFTVKTIDIDFRTSTQRQWNEEEIIESGKIKKGKCVLFLSKKGYVENIERENPYLEVINIETVFPSKLVIHCAERREVFALQQENQIVYCDKDLKVLKVEDGTFSSSKENPILLENLTIKNEVKIGTFLKVEEKGIERFLSSMTENYKTFPQTLGFCKSIKLERVNNKLSNKDETNLTLTTFANREIKILNIEGNLPRKLQKAFQALPQLYDLLVTNGDYTNEEVDRCSLLIGNQITDENELYVHIYLDGKVVESVKKE